MADGKLDGTGNRTVANTAPMEICSISNDAPLHAEHDGTSASSVAALQPPQSQSVSPQRSYSSVAAGLHTSNRFDALQNDRVITCVLTGVQLNLLLWLNI